MHMDSRVGTPQDAPAAVPVLRLGVVAVLFAGLAIEARGGGNGLCWYNSGRTYEDCCISEGRTPETEEACWTGLWFTEDFCCHPLPPGYQQCYEVIERRLLAKVENLEMWEAASAQGALGRDHEGLAMVGPFIDTYRHLLSHPLSLWNLACSFPASPLVWSENCACCEPKEDGCDEIEEPVIHPAHWQCCYPTYARNVLEPPDERLEASIQAHLGSLSVSRREVADRGGREQYRLASQCMAAGCVISLRDGRVIPCDEGHACPDFDCSYMRAFVLTLTVIQGIKPLPDMDLLLNAGDVTLYDSSLPTFTRTGTRWTNTIAIPFEWQLHPGQCFKHLKAAIQAAENIPWERRQPVLVWRGSNSNCFFPECNIARASDDGHAGPAMEACGRMEAWQERDCTWNSSTWLRMPRGRLVWLSRFSPSIDARFVRSRHLPMDPVLEEFLLGEGLIASEPMNLEEQAHFKYAIAVEGDSAPDRVYWQLFTGSVLLLPEGPWQVFAVAGLLEPYVHYVPVRYDLGDLLEKVAWLQQNDAEARSIARRGAAFARRHLTCNGIVNYVDRLLRAYASRHID